MLLTVRVGRAHDVLSTLAVMVEARPVQRETRKSRMLRYDAGSLALNLVCTVGRRGGRPIERLPGCADLATWLGHHGMSLPSAAVDEEFLSSVQQLREALYGFLHALAVGEVPAAAAVELINERAGIPVAAPMIVFAETGVAVRRALDTGQVLALIAQDGIGHLTDPDRLGRLSVCAAQDCRMLYLGSGQGTRRQWCSMEYCGNRVKAANHRARHQTARPGPGR